MNVIEQLRRLERAGAEHSIQVDRLMLAARELEAEIISRESMLDGYSVVDGRLVHITTGEHVSSSRSAALRFSLDVEMGLHGYDGTRPDKTGQDETRQHLT